VGLCPLSRESGWRVPERHTRDWYRYGAMERGW
jgi:hypothetical protein